MTFSRLINVPCTSANSTGTLVLIPGGPGLSSETLRRMDILSRSFDLIYVDPPGSGETPLAQPMKYDDFLLDVEATLLPLEGPIILIGHSFGGIIAAEIATRKKLAIEGLVLMGSPIRLETLKAAGEIFEREVTPELKKTTANWNSSSTDDTFRKWLGSYGPFYFIAGTEKQGREMLLRDRVSANLFLGSRSAANEKEWVLKACREIKVPRLFLAGENDIFIPPANLRKDAALGEFDFHIIKNASHFIMFDQPEAVAQMIEQTFKQRRSGK